MGDKINITFLGTGASIPTKTRNHTGIFLSWKNENILIDCGEGIQRQFRLAEIPPTKITKILLTHWHADHSLGLAGLLHTLSMSGYSKTLHLHGPVGTKEKVNLLEKTFGKFRIKLNITESSNKVFENNEIIIDSSEMLHNSPVNAYSFTIKEKRRLDKKKLKKLKLPNSPLLGELQKGKDIYINGKKIKASSLSYIEKQKKVSFILDTAPNKNSIALANNSDILICESSFSSEEKEKAQEYFHLTSSQAAEIAKKSKSQKLVLVHISQRHEHNTKKLLNESRKIFKNTFIPKDLDKLAL